MKISRVGYTRCPGCLCHVKVAASDPACPFCGEELRDVETLGGGAIEKLRSSRSALIAMGLAGGVTFAVACGTPDPKPGPDNNTSKNTNGNSTNTNPDNITDPNIQADYGGFDYDFGNPDPVEPADMGVDMAEPPVTPDYGGFDPDAG